MKPQKRYRWIIGLTSMLCLAPACWAQSQSNSTQTGGTGGINTGNNSGASSSTIGMNLPTMDFNQGRTSTGTGGTGGTSRNTRRTTARTGGAGSSSILGGSAAGLGSAGRSTGSPMQMNRQNQSRTQYITRIGFTPVPATPAATNLVLASVEESLTAIASPGIRVAMDGNTAVLSGTVASDHDRKLAERMALLEPGVREVRNELVVDSAGSKE